MGFGELVAIIAAVMALNALALDQMLPALPAIGKSLHVASANDRQWVITAYFLGLGVGSLFYGSLSDRFGRKPVLVTATILFLLSTLWCMLAQSFAVMLFARGLEGLFAAAGRVVTVSIIRDRFVGDRMARVSSLIFFTFIIVPVIGPSLGQLTLQVADWRWIFATLLFLGGPLLVWMLLRLPETLEPQNRVEVSFLEISAMLRAVVSSRIAIGYMLSTGFVSGALTGFMVSVQQIFADVFHWPAIFPIAFAAMACFMGLGSYFNSRLVEGLGARRLSHLSLMFMMLIAALHCLVILSGHESLSTFMLVQVLTTLAFAFSVPNLSAISMAPFERGSGFASSFQASLTAIMSSLLGAAIGSAFNASPLPIALGFLVLGAAGLFWMTWADRWRLEPDRFGSNRSKP
jgi:DHA1 family bicyclomycin/chloramphenicol resistance-like MFS transporter